MKKMLIMMASLFFAISAYAQTTPADLHALRQKLIRAVNSSKTTDSLYRVLEKMPNKPPVITGYIGALTMLKGKHAWNPYTKMKYLNAGEKVMQQAVTADTHNIELRYLRFAVEEHLPGFLGMAKNLDYGTADQLLVSNTIKLLLESKKCSAKEEKALYKQLAEIN
jgi:hypothetical protein